MAFTMGLADVKNNFSRVTAEINRSGHPVTVLKNNKPWVIISPVQASGDVDREALDIAVDFMEEYRSVFEELAK